MVLMSARMPCAPTPPQVLGAFGSSTCPVPSQAPADEDDPVVEDGQHHDGDPTVVPISRGVQGPASGGGGAAGGGRGTSGLPHPRLAASPHPARLRPPQPCTVARCCWQLLGSASPSSWHRVLHTRRSCGTEGCPRHVLPLRSPWWAAVPCSPPGMSSAGARLGCGNEPGRAVWLGPNPAVGQHGAESVHPALRAPVRVLHLSSSTQWVLQPSHGTEHGPSAGFSCVTPPAPGASWQHGAPQGTHRPTGTPGLQTAVSPAMLGVLGQQSHHLALLDRGPRAVADRSGDVPWGGVEAPGPSLGADGTNWIPAVLLMSRGHTWPLQNYQCWGQGCSGQGCRLQL